MKKHLETQHLIDQSFNATSFWVVKGAALSFGYGFGGLLESAYNCSLQYYWITNDFTPIEETLIQLDKLGISPWY